MPALNPRVHLARLRMPLLALAALLGLAAAALFALAPAAAQTPPPGLELTLSLVEDSDNIVAAGSTVRVRATLSHENARLGPFTVNGGALRLSGGREWEESGRTGLTINAAALTGQGPNNVVPFIRDGVNAGLGGAAVAVMESGAGDIVVVGYPKANMNGMANAGAVDLFIGGKFVTRITAGADAHEDAEFGSSVAVGGPATDPLIAIGAPRDNVDTCPQDPAWIAHNPDNRYWRCSRGAPDVPERNAAGAPTNDGQGAVYLFKLNDTDSDVVRLARLGPSDYEQSDPSDPNQAGARQIHMIVSFGAGVAVNADGTHVAISGSPGLQTGDSTANADRWDNAAGWVFSRPTGGSPPTPIDGWRDMLINNRTHVSLLNPGTYASDQNYGGESIAFSGDGEVVAIGHPIADYPFGNNPTVLNIGAVSVFRKPAAGWTQNDGLAPAVNRILRAGRLTVGAHAGAISSTECLQVGTSVALDSDGSTVVAGAGGISQKVAEGCHNRSPNMHDWKGAVVVWENASWPNNPGSDGPSDRTDLNSATTVLSNPNSHANDQFGSSVAISGNGRTIAASGEVYELESTDGGYSVLKSGTAHVFYDGNGTWTSAGADGDTAITAPRATPNAMFGARAGVAIDGDTLVVGQSEAPHSLFLPGGLITHDTFLYSGLGTGRAWSFDLTDVHELESESSKPARQTAIQNSADELSPSAGCSARVLDDTTRWTCVLALPNTEIVIPDGTPDGKFTISGSFTIENGETDLTLTDTLEVTVGTVTEVASAELALAQDTGDPTTSDDDKPFTSVLAKRGDRTTLQLRVLNSGGGGAGANSIASVLVTTSRGKLYTRLGGGCIGGSGGISCQIPVSALNAGNTGNIRLSLEHPGMPGTAVVRASIQPRIGAIIDTGTVSVVFAGAAEDLTISAPRTSVLNVDTPDAGDADVDADDVDNRDLMTLSVSAKDASGNDVDVPNPTSGRVVIRDPDNRVVYSAGTAERSSFAVTWPKPYSGPPAARPADGYARDNQNRLQLEVDVNAATNAALATGQYSLTLTTTGNLTFTRNFIVTGGAATLTFDKVEGSTARGGSFSVKATVLDADGTPVPDGTPVSWADGSTSPTAVMVELSKQTTTTNGEASASYLVVGLGNAWVRATATPATDVKLVSVGHEPREVSPAEGLTNARPNDFTTWFGDAMIYASDILADVEDERITAILLWQNGKWLRYAVSGGQEIPGSMDFHVDPGVVLWLGG